MNISLLNTRISIQRCSIVEDAIGNHSANWSEYYSCYATVSGESDTEKDDAATTVDNSRADFTVRFCRETATVEPLSFRVMLDGQIYDILSVDHMNYKRRSVKLRCRKARR